MSEQQRNLSEPPEPRNFRDVVRLWPSRNAMVEAMPKMTKAMVEKISERNAMNALHDLDLVQACQKIGREDITAEVVDRIRYRSHLENVEAAKRAKKNRLESEERCPPDSSDHAA